MTGPVAWIRFCGDGCVEGPILDSVIEEVQRKSGAWTPLYAAPQPAPAIDLEQFREAVESLRLGATRAEHHEECDRLLALIDGQRAAPRGPDQPDLCDLCRTREEVRSDAEGIPFCQECWDGWQAEEAKAVQP